MAPGAATVCDANDESAEKERIFQRMNNNHELLVRAEVLHGRLSHERLMALSLAAVRQLEAAQQRMMQRHRLALANAEGIG